MRNIGISALLVVSIFLVGFTYLEPEKATEGKIVYDVEIVESDLSYLEEMMIGTASLSISFKEEFIRTDFNVAISETAIIQDGAKNSGLMLMSVMGMKKAILLDKQKEGKVSPKITYLDETKTIVGHSCKKAIIEIGDGTQLTSFYTDKIMPKNMNSKYTYEEMKGFPLEMEVKQDGMILKLTAEKVELAPQGNDKFTLDVPAGYEITTFEELEKMIPQK